MPNENQRDLVLGPGTFALVLDGTKGLVNTYVGPTKTTLSEQDRAVRYSTSSRKFEPVDTLSQAIQPFVFASEGSYVILQNPTSGSVDGKDHPGYPQEGGNGQQTPRLQYGRTINVRGPVQFALWPSQSAQVIEGHTLRSNQYLLCRVYNAEAAKENWQNSIAMPQQTAGDQTKSLASKIDPKSLVTGQYLIIEGTEVSFYIPPTGIEVVIEDDKYVRDAVTLERLEYCILIDEDGNKRIERGPQVVFPHSTERFVTQTVQGQVTRRFRAYILSKLQALHLQVIADYTDPVTNKSYKSGDEIVIYGKETPIYFPSIEHAVLKYGEQELHNSVAVPRGDGRYVLDRLGGDVKLVKGPTMLMPDPTKEVMIRRILTPKQASLWYPGNSDVLNYNVQLANMAAEESDNTGQRFISDSRVRSRTSPRTESLEPEASNFAFSKGITAAAAPGMFANEIKRGTSYTPPRTISLESSKYEGAVNISPFIGYAVQVVKKTGERRVVVGPATHLLEYDETLEVVRLSKGTPKNHDDLVETVYLQVKNNRVTDVVVVETEDMVKVAIKLSYRVNFEGDSTKWFSVDNYVKLLCQAAQSRLSREAKGYQIGDFYKRTIDIVRDTILGPKSEGKKRTGMVFEENGMEVYDVEIISVTISDNNIQRLLIETQVSAFQDTLNVSNAKRRLDNTKSLQGINRQIEEEMEQSKQAKLKLEAATKELQIQNEISSIIGEYNKKLQHEANALTLANKELETIRAKEAINNEVAQADQNRLKESAEIQNEIEIKKQQLQLNFLVAETEAMIKRVEATKESLGDTLLALSSQETMQKLAQASAPMTLLGGPNIMDVLEKVFQNTPFGKPFQNMRKQVGNDGLGRSLRKEVAVQPE